MYLLVNANEQINQQRINNVTQPVVDLYSVMCFHAEAKWTIQCRGLNKYGNSLVVLLISQAFLVDLNGTFGGKRISDCR